MDRNRWERVNQLYHAALERAPEARAAFLVEACADDSELRREVETLLSFDEQAAGFMEADAFEAVARELDDEELSETKAQALISQQLGAYKILAVLGRGGMGEVYLALDTRLNRKVAVKLLPAEFTHDLERVQRFAQEARAASALNHPNIITIHEIGQHEHSHYIVTEYVEGETLRTRLRNVPQRRLAPGEAVGLVIQLATALATAHAAGIIHRDIKPENVMVRRDGIVKVLDFGLAKLMEPQISTAMDDTSTEAHVKTQSGVVLGTASYMSPEQARGLDVDARTDLFSLGAVLYEMIAGHAPFRGATLSDILLAVIDKEPLPLVDVPAELQRIIAKALRKERAERYQTSQELLADLKTWQHEQTVGSARAEAAASPVSKRRLVVFALLASLIFAVAGLITWAYFHRQSLLTEKDTILLADFDNQTGDAIFDGTLKQGLAIQLQQSPFLNLFPEPQVRQTLREMNRPPDIRVTAELAREICERHNLKALITGSIAPLGSHYAITLEAINGQSGESLARGQVEAESREQVLRALSQAATQLRERLGESLSLIQRFDKPLEQATTSKLEAFKAWSLGIEQSYNGRPMEAIPFYKRAVELDPEFAHAYSVLSVVYWATGRPRLAAEYAEKGYRLRERVSEYEKIRITSFYHGFATGNLDKRIEVVMVLKRTYPRELSGPADLSLTYNLIGQYDQAVAEAREAIHLNSNFAPSRWGLGQALLRLNRFAEAKDALLQALQQKLDRTEFHAYLYQIAFINNDTTGMQQQIGYRDGRPDEYVAFDWQAGAAAFAGQWRKAQDFSRQAIDLAARGETIEVAAQYATEQALRGAVFGDCRKAKTNAAQGLKLERGRASLPRAALALALCNGMNQAKPLIDELAKLYPEDTLINSLWLPVIRAAMELQRGKAAQAIEQLQSTTRYEAAAEFWPQYLRGQAYLKLGRGVEATAEFQKILDHRGYAPLSPLSPLAHLGLARAVAMVGDMAKARQAYEGFLALWKDADAELPALIEAKQEFEKPR